MLSEGLIYTSMNVTADRRQRNTVFNPQNDNKLKKYLKSVKGFIIDKKHVEIISR